MIFYVQHGNQFTISVTDNRAKTRNLRRDPRAALFVPSDDVFIWVTLDGTVELSAVATSPDDATCDALVEYYRASVGEHEDWAAYRQAMINDQRLIATFTATSAAGMLPQ